MINNVTIEGYLANDPRVNEEAGYGYMTVACRRNFKNKKTDSYDSDFFSVRFGGERFMKAVNYLHKGSYVIVTGELHNSVKEVDGKNITERETISMSSLSFGPKTNKESADTAPSETRPSKPAKAPAKPAEEVIIDDDDDIPF